MAKKKIPTLPVAEALQDSDLLVLEQSSGTKKLALSNLVQYLDLDFIPKSVGSEGQILQFFEGQFC